MKLFVRLVVLALFGYLIYSLFFGALLFINPVKLEYEHIKGQRSDIYAKDITKLELFYYEIENDMIQAEELTGLKFTERPLVFVAQDVDEFSGFVPWITNRKNLGGVSLQVGNVIYINSEKIKTEEYREREIFRHELMHNLISQNSIVINYFIMDNNQWFIKGLASYYGGPKYMSDIQFIQEFKAKKPDFDMVSPKVFVKLPDDIKFNYSLYRLFIKFLIDHYGMDKFRTFTTRYVEAPTNYGLIFYEVYEEKMVLVIEEFMHTYKSFAR